ncbi:G-protein coupled receptor family C group 6 member A-like [Kryptolebias marmoratus]|uniref:G-protein coupled receptor family C group 6 member A-like n=1 Tax=Kryptolebias marmoratus TaxID=37003 RepID=UPI0018ACEA37|nr:G-protein coupled receptor family C group 6 member A-like [Kryptolebias marmoratus]
MLLLRLLVTFMSLFHSYSEIITVLHAYSPGDIIIGGLFPIHLNTNKTKPRHVVCTEYNLQMFLRSQVMIYAIKEINQRTPRLLPNLTLGYDIYDTCGDSILAVRETLQLMKNQSDPQSCLLPDHINSSLPEPQTKVVIGERYSDVSIAVARFLALTSVAQISYASSSEVLSKKFKFPTFFRTVPSDEFQTKAIYELVKEFNWKTVAIVGSDDEYGKYGSDRLQYIFSKSDVCVAFVEILSGGFLESSSDSQDPLKNLAEKIKNSVAEAIIMFTKDDYIESILKKAIENNMNRTWIASDSWSTATHIATLPGIEKIGQVFGFIFKRNEVPGFRDHVRSMFNRSKNDILKSHMERYPLCSKRLEECNCSMECSDPNCLASCVDQDESYSIYLAVQVIAEGLRRLLKCDIHSCERTEFTAFELLEKILNINITVNTTNIYFKEGDPILGYDIVYWNSSGSNQGMTIDTIGAYWPNQNETISLPQFPKYLLKKMKSENVSVFNCSKTCDPGHMLQKQSETCCPTCARCEDRKVSNGEMCESCEDWQYSNEGRDKCLNKTHEFLDWTDPISITMSFFSVLAIIIVIAFAVVIILNYNTPVVKSIGGCLCFLELLSLLFNFCLTFTYLGKPTKTSCVGIPLFGFGFSVCMSCILSNLLQILVGFKFDLKVRSWIKKLNQPIAVVITISGIQLALSVSWLILIPTQPTEDHKNTTILHQCKMYEGSQNFLIATIAYNAFLGFISFLFAFKGKQLPDLYKNAVLITVSMVLFLIIWIIFLPLFLSLEGKYKPASNCAAILISSYSILGCHLAPKCYIMVFRKERNNQNAISEYIRKHYEREGIAVVK